MDIEYIQNLTQKIDVLLSNYQKLCQELRQLKEELSNKNTLIVKLQEEIDLLNKERDTVKEKVSAIISKIDQVEEELSITTEDNREIVQEAQAEGTTPSLEGF